MKPPWQLTSHATRHVYDTRLPALRKREVLAAVEYLHLPPEVKDSAPVIDVFQAKPEDFSLAQATPKPQNRRYTVPLADLITHLSRRCLGPRLTTLIRQLRPTDRPGPHRVPSETTVIHRCLQDARQRCEDAASVLGGSKRIRV